MNRKLIVLIGVSCSGKTTWAKKYLKENDKVYYVSRDQERTSIFGEYRMGSKKEEDLITEIVKNKVATLLRAGTVILDNTHLKRKYIDEVIKDFPNTDIDFKVFPLPSTGKQGILQRNQDRFKKEGKFIPEEVINKQLIDFEKLKVPNNISTRGLKTDPRIKEWDYYTVTENSKIAYIFDLDGTLALMNGRMAYDGSSCASDLLNYPLSLILVNLKKSGALIYVLSGRSEGNGAKMATEKWLEDNGMSDYIDKLVMRKEGDYRPDAVVKKEMFREHVSEDVAVVGVFDDRNQVVDLWRSMGIPTYQVYYGNF